jgi:transcription initiation factor TFIIIB Brf1 subunit/transcription initiation factor TFIIB
MSTYALVRDLKKQGFTSKEIAAKLGISENTVYLYLHSSREKLGITQKGYRQRAKLKELKNLIAEELNCFSLPIEWADLALELTQKQIDPSRGFRGAGPKALVDSVLMLICRRCKVPTPINLVKATRKFPKGRTTKGRKFSYVEVLEKLDGVKTPEPTDYINKFFSDRPEFKEALPEALVIAEHLPSQFKQGRKPSLLAAACVYLSSKGSLLQREIAEYFGTTEVSLRYTLRQIEHLQKEKS